MQVASHPGRIDDETVAWLLGGDPAIRWQVARDLLGATDAEVAAERERVAAEGWGARLLGLQDPQGTWAHALYIPKWTSTTYTLLLLAWLGLPPGHPQALAGCRALWDGARFFGAGLTLARTIPEPEICMTGMLVFLSAALGHADERVRPTLAWLLDQQLGDGGWNCQAIRAGSRHGSFHTTIIVLEALDAAAGTPLAAGLAERIDRAARRGREFLLVHRLYRSHRTGEVVDAALLRWRFPPQWHYDVLRGLDHFRAAGAPFDERMTDALAVVERARGGDGRWPTRSPYPGRAWFALEPRGASRWHTLRALRVLRRYAG